MGYCDKIFLYFRSVVNISILTLKNAVLASIAHAAYVFATVNGLLKRLGKEPMFEVKLVRLSGEGPGGVPGGRSGEVRLNEGEFVDPVSDRRGDHTDPIIILMARCGGATYPNKDCPDRRTVQGGRAAGAPVPGLSVGVLSRQRCTTHWAQPMSSGIIIRI